MQINDLNWRRSPVVAQFGGGQSAPRRVRFHQNALQLPARPINGLPLLRVQPAPLRLRALRVQGRRASIGTPGWFLVVRMVSADFTAVANERERLLRTWTERFDGRSAPRN